MFKSCFYVSFTLLSNFVKKKKKKRGNEWPKKGEIKDTERVGEGGNGVRGDAGARWVNVMD